METSGRSSTAIQSDASMDQALSRVRVSVLTKPLHRVRERLARRRLRETEFPDGLCRIEKHFVAGHAYAGERSFGRFAREARDKFVDVSGRESDAIGDLETRCRNAGDLLEHGESFAHRPVAFRVAQDVALADASLFCGEDVP